MSPIFVLRPEGSSGSWTNRAKTTSTRRISLCLSRSRVRSHEPCGTRPSPHSRPPTRRPSRHCTAAAIHLSSAIFWTVALNKHPTGGQSLQRCIGQTPGRRPFRTALRRRNARPMAVSSNGALGGAPPVGHSMQLRVEGSPSPRSFRPETRHGRPTSRTAVSFALTTSIARLVRVPALAPPPTLRSSASASPLSARLRVGGRTGARRLRG